MQHILIVGGGFAGVWAALGAAAARREPHARRARIAITLLTREPYLTIRPRLYEANPESVRVPLEQLLEATDVDLVLGTATAIDVRARAVAIDMPSGPATIPYDRLILAAGSRLRRPSIPGASELAFSVDTYGEAMALEHHLQALGGRPASRGRFTAVVAGAGFAGIEVATTLVSRLRSASARAAGEPPGVVLVERAEMVAPDLGRNPRPIVESALRDLGISLRLGTSIDDIGRDDVTLSTGERIPAHTTVWTAGLSASDLTLQLPAERDALGRVIVDSCLRVPGLDGVLVAGDAARAMADSAHVAPMSCQYAVPMGELAGRNAVAELLDRDSSPFRPPPYVTCLDLGDAGAVFTQGWDREVHLSGFWGKMMKQMINTRLIYPATDHGASSDRARARAALSAA